MKRRSLLLLVLALPFLAACDSVENPPPEEEETLRFYADQRDLYIGAAATVGPLSEAKYSEILPREFNMLVAENEMKFGPLHPTMDTYNFGPADRLVNFAEENDMAVRGHTLIWHTQLPSWITQVNWTRDQMIEIMRDHIHTVMGRYKGRIMAWDVVNEAIADNGTLRNTVWLQRIGPEYIAMAFEFAHEADPDALLFYNDYNTEGTGAKSDAVYNLMQSLKQNGTPVHGVGFQMHVSTSFAPTAAQVAANMERLGNLGLQVHITEMDVRMPLPPNGNELAKQAEVYERMLNVCLDAFNCTSFVLWGFTDKHSWVPNQFPGNGAALIFDEAYEPKPAYRWLLDALKGSN